MKHGPALHVANAHVCAVCNQNFCKINMPLAHGHVQRRQAVDLLGIHVGAFVDEQGDALDVLGVAWARQISNRGMERGPLVALAPQRDVCAKLDEQPRNLGVAVVDCNVQKIQVVRNGRVEIWRDAALGHVFEQHIHHMGAAALDCPEQQSINVLLAGKRMHHFFAVEHHPHHRRVAAVQRNLHGHQRALLVDVDQQVLNGRETLVQQKPHNCRPACAPPTCNMQHRSIEPVAHAALLALLRHPDGFDDGQRRVCDSKMKECSELRNWLRKRPQQHFLSFVTPNHPTHPSFVACQNSFHQLFCELRGVLCIDIDRNMTIE
eukprot:comp16417_c0_seq1/m.26245 comp16417_c0_seq1/g.26245  ORF comp16417_c0_seq1/g.26245 comp16417_c0_seq1/m.26245 type:complete len:320 (+) comp16417_c0_seq1:308-1267(+)